MGGDGGEAAAGKRLKLARALVDLVILALAFLGLAALLAVTLMLAPVLWALDRWYEWRRA